MAGTADPSLSWRILRRSGISSLCAGAAGLVLTLSLHRIGGEVVLDARALAELSVFFLILLAGELMTFYSLLLAKGLVPDVSLGLARKRSWIPIAAFLLALAIHVRVLDGTGSTLLLVEMVGNGRAVGAPGDEDAGEDPEGHDGAGIAGDGGGVGVEAHAE